MVGGGWWAVAAILVDIEYRDGVHIASKYGISGIRDNWNSNQSVNEMKGDSP